MIVKESGIDFIFDSEYTVVKFDDTDFYRHKFSNSLPNGKGVDFIAMSDKSLILLEVKNCLGYEKDNMWRTQAGKQTDKGETFDVEIAKKVASTIACISGANTFQNNSLKEADDLKPYFDFFNAMKKGKKTIYVVLFLEGDFKLASRDKKMIMKSIHSKINAYLKWLTCNILVIDSNINNNLFKTQIN